MLICLSFDQFYMNKSEFVLKKVYNLGTWSIMMDFLSSNRIEVSLYIYMHQFHVLKLLHNGLSISFKF